MADKTLSHLDDENRPQIVDVSAKNATRRMAHARATLEVPEAVAALFRDGDIQSKKGPVFQTAILAGVMGAKRTPDLIPLCHPIGLEDCQIDIRMAADNRIVIDCQTVVTHKTGVEMEALTGASIAALTVYDMCKAISHDIRIADLRLMEKRGGKSDYKVPS